EPLDPDGWKWSKSQQGKFSGQFKKPSAYKPPHRTPNNFALVKDAVFAAFALEAKCQTTGKDNPPRNLCLSFGYQDAAHFYYAHLGKRADDHANQIFIVNKADRKKISTRTTTGTNWTDGWHRVKVVRSIGDGRIEVYFDDLKTPAMTAKDVTFPW